jgi:hypothetical protein
MLRSMTTTWAPLPTAICAAFEPTTPPPRMTILRRRHAGDAAEQDTHAAMRLFEAVGAGLHRQAAGDFRHRRQQWQAAAGLGDRFIGDADRTALDQIGTLRRIGREMQIGIENLALAQHRALAGLRFLDLDDHFGGQRSPRRSGNAAPAFR